MEWRLIVNFIPPVTRPLSSVADLLDRDVVIPPHAHDQGNVCATRRQGNPLVLSARGQTIGVVNDVKDGLVTGAVDGRRGTVSTCEKREREGL